MSHYFRAVGFGVAIAFVLLDSIPTPAQTTPQLIQFQPDKVFFEQNPPSGTGNGGAKSGTVSRGSCPETETPLTAFVPSSSDARRVAGLTLSEHPTFWFYMPYTRADKIPAPVFLLEDSQGNKVHKTAVKLPAAPGVISIPMPSTVSLQPQAWYHWTFDVACKSPPITTSGWIQRVNPPAATKQLAPKSLQQAVFYAQNNLWFDALTVLMELHQAKPQDSTIATNLKTLLIQGRVEETTVTEAIAK